MSKLIKTNKLTNLLLQLKIQVLKKHKTGV